MTTITVEIDKDKDLLDLKKFIDQLGLKYQVEENEDLLYADELKNSLDKRYSDYTSGLVDMVSSSESQEKIQTLLAAKK
jgi:hypothetical protein